MDDARPPTAAPVATLPRAAFVAIAALAAALCTGTVLVSDAGSEDRVISGIVHVLLVAVPVGVGLIALAHRPGDRFARLLVVAGLLWSTTALAESGDPTAYSTGRIAAWLVEPLLVYLLLSFPSGHLARGLEQRLFGAMVALVALLYVPTALVADQFPERVPWATCDVDCPANAFSLAGSEPAIVEAFVRPLRETLTALLYLAVAAHLVRRRRSAGPLLRRALLPVVATAAFRALALIVYLLARAVDPSSDQMAALGWAYVLSLPIVAVGFGVGLILRGLYAARALERLAAALRALTSPRDLRPAMADALDDASLRILFWRPGEPGHWIDDSGWPVRAPRRDDKTDVTEVAVEGRRIAAIEHDAALAQDPALMQAAASYALTVLENNRLVGELRSSVGELARSRARVVAVGDEVRRRLERDLHDGAQQRLVALRMELGVQSALLEERDADTAARLAALGEDVEQTIDEVRALAHGIYPSLLADRGLAAALTAAARSSTIPASVDTDGIGRFTPEVESTVYFACLEALQNASKHASGATRVAISLWVADGLEFEVRDDGAGFDEQERSAGAGLTNLRDRLSTVGGTITVRSTPGAGTRVTGTVPVGTG
jgi:signal transduction histidine kinase